MRLGVTLIVAALIASGAADARAESLICSRTYPEVMTNGQPARFTAATLAGTDVIAVGPAYQGGFDADFVIAKIDPTTCSLVPPFGNGGFVRVPIDLKADGGDIPYDVAIGPGGRIVVVGEAAGPGSGSDMVALALTAAGAPDTTFGPGGIRTFDFGGSDAAHAVAIDGGGVATIGGHAGGNPSGFAAVKVDATGQPVTGFDSDGRLVTKVSASGLDDTIEKLLPEAGGTIIGLGVVDDSLSTPSIGFVRYDASGLVGSPVVQPGAGSDDVADALLFTPTGSATPQILVGDSANVNSANQAVLKGYDTAFAPLGGGFGGNVFGTPSFFGGLALGPGNSVYAAGTAPAAGNGDDFWLMALDIAGHGANATHYGNTVHELVNALEIEAQLKVAFMAGQRELEPLGVSVDLAGTATPSATPTPTPTPTITPVPKADLSVSLERPSLAGLAGAQQFEQRVDVKNLGPAAAEAVIVEVSFLRDPRSVMGVSDAKLILADGSVVTPNVACTRATCALLAPLPAGATLFVVFDAVAQAPPGPHEVVDFFASATTETPEASYDNNDATQTYVLFNPLAKLRRAGPKGVSGVAASSGQRAASPYDVLAAITKVQVALLREGKGARGAAGARCRWLKSVRGGFVRSKPKQGKCAPSPRWLQVKGTTKWKLRLKRRLKRGRWVVYARAWNAAGVHTVVFSKARGNRVAFRVR